LKNQNSGINKITESVKDFAPGIYFYVIKAKTIYGDNIKFSIKKFIITR